MILTEKGYLPRLIDAKIRRYMGLFGALSIEGPKWCGKTWTSLNHAASVVYILDPEDNYANREAAHMNPASILAGEKPILVDEWQEVPGIWDAVRFASDKARKKGLFLLTGSVTPREKTYTHSGAGRIARIRMHPMSLFESGFSGGEVSLGALFKGKKIEGAASRLNQKILIDLIIRGGWPENIKVSKKNAGILPQEYINALAETDVSHADAVKRNPQLVRQLLASLARVNATTALNAAITLDVQSRFGSVTRQTVTDYINILVRLYVIDEIPQWFPSLRDKLRLRKTPKRIFTDPSIAAGSLKAQADDLSRDPATLGSLFENLCLRDLLVYAETIGAAVSHYHDSNGLEVDAIVELGNKWAALEIKMGLHRIDEGVKALSTMSAKIQSKGAPPPAFLAVITAAGPAYTRKDGIHVIPIDCLRE